MHAYHHTGAHIYSISKEQRQEPHWFKVNQPGLLTGFSTEIRYTLTIRLCAFPLSSLTFHIIVHNVVSVQVGQCLESAPEDVFGVVHHQLKHGGLLLVLHQEVGEGTVAHLGQVALQVTTHARHEVVAEVARGTLGVLLTHHHCS